MNVSHVDFVWADAPSDQHRKRFRYEPVEFSTKTAKLKRIEDVKTHRKNVRLTTIDDRRNLSHNESPLHDADKSRQRRLLLQRWQAEKAKKLSQKPKNKPFIVGAVHAPLTFQAPPLPPNFKPPNVAQPVRVRPVTRNSSKSIKLVNKYEEKSVTNPSFAPQHAQFNPQLKVRALNIMNANKVQSSTSSSLKDSQETSKLKKNMFNKLPTTVPKQGANNNYETDARVLRSKSHKDKVFKPKNEPAVTVKFNNKINKKVFEQSTDTNVNKNQANYSYKNMNKSMKIVKGQANINTFEKPTSKITRSKAAYTGVLNSKISSESSIEMFSTEGLAISPKKKDIHKNKPKYNRFIGSKSSDTNYIAEKKVTLKNSPVLKLKNARKRSTEKRKMSTTPSTNGSTEKVLTRRITRSIKTTKISSDLNTTENKNYAINVNNQNIQMQLVDTGTKSTMEVPSLKSTEQRVEDLFGLMDINKSIKGEEKSINLENVSPTGVIPKVTISRGKYSACRENRQKIANGLLADDHVENESADHFKILLGAETTRILEMCTEWHEYSLENQSLLNENAQDLIRATIGQAKLLINKKFKQFSELIDQCATSFVRPMEGPVTVTDLQGFWDLVFIQVEDVDIRFKKLSQAKARCWVEEDVPAQRRPKMRAKKPAASRPATSQLRGLIDAARKAAHLKPSELTCSKLSPEPEDMRKFDGGFFMIESPISQPSPGCTPNRKAMLHKTLLPTESRDSASKATVSRAIMRASLIAKQMPDDDSISQTNKSPDRAEVNLGITPARSILKTPASQIGLKTRKVVLFDTMMTDTTSACDDDSDISGVKLMTLTPENVEVCNRKKTPFASKAKIEINPSKSPLQNPTSNKKILVDINNFHEDSEDFDMDIDDSQAGLNSSNSQSRASSSTPKRKTVQKPLNAEDTNTYGRRITRLSRKLSENTFRDDIDMSILQNQRSFRKISSKTKKSSNNCESVNEPDAEITEIEKPRRRSGRQAKLRAQAFLPDETSHILVEKVQGSNKKRLSRKSDSILNSHDKENIHNNSFSTAPMKNGIQIKNT